jgi:hypothetical protein
MTTKNSLQSEVDKAYINQVKQLITNEPTYSNSYRKLRKSTPASLLYSRNVSKPAYPI